MVADSRGHDALEASALDSSVVGEFSGKFAVEPSEEDTGCTKLVFNHFSDRLTSVRCDAQRYYASDRTTTSQSIQFWEDLKHNWSDYRITIVLKLQAWLSRKSLILACWNYLN